MEHRKHPTQLLSTRHSASGEGSNIEPQAFSLIELLVVVAIMVLVCAFTFPAVNSMLTSYNIGAGADMVVGQLESARQSTIALNRAVEVRFYRYAIQGMAGEQPSSPATGKYRALQIFQYNPTGAALPLTKVMQLPTGIIFDSGTLSSLLAAIPQKTYTPPLDPQVNLPECGTNYLCTAYQIYPGGNTTLASSQWFVTLHRLTDGDALTSPPHNYATIQVDPVSGVVRLYRP